MTDKQKLINILIKKANQLDEQGLLEEANTLTKVAQDLTEEPQDELSNLLSPEQLAYIEKRKQTPTYHLNDEEYYEAMKFPDMETKIRTIQFLADKYKNIEQTLPAIPYAEGEQWNWEEPFAQPRFNIIQIWQRLNDLKKDRHYFDKFSALSADLMNKSLDYNAQKINEIKQSLPDNESLDNAISQLSF